MTEQDSRHAPTSVPTLPGWATSYLETMRTDAFSRDLLASRIIDALKADPEPDG